MQYIKSCVKVCSRLYTRKIILYTVPGKEGFYSKFGFSKMKTAMAIFHNQDQAKEWKLVE